jgi:chromosome condensin MukBEF MukE localization factor
LDFLTFFVSDYFFQGQRLFEKLLQLTSQNIEIKLVSDVTAGSKALEALRLKGKAKVDVLLYQVFC